MKDLIVEDLLAFDGTPLELERVTGAAPGRLLFVSLNPDLRTDFGHFLNYERRLRECCERAGHAYACLAHSDVAVDWPDTIAVFPSDSGHYALLRREANDGWRPIVHEFHRVVTVTLEALRRREDAERIVLFLYCGSSLLANRLADLQWPTGTEVVINAFWDFLMPSGMGYAHVPRLSFQQRVRLLAMSSQHADELFAATGLRFDSIPNPPPLLGDLQTLDALVAQRRVACGDTQGHLRVLVPGLMTLGKGRDSTEALYRTVCEQAPAGMHFVFRDRTGVLPRSTNPAVSVRVGDLDDEEVKQAYREADAVVLPYDAATFRIRTSGAIVDALCYGATPLVMAGTWLADACFEHDFGIVLGDMSPATVLKALAELRERREVEVHRLYLGAVRYLSRHTWRRLYQSIAGAPSEDSFETRSPCLSARPSQSLLAEANRLMREGDYRTAALLYDWLDQACELPIYRQNLEICARRAGVSVDRLLRLESAS